MKQKHFIDIQNIREESTELRESNTAAFHAGDIIQISEKVDGSNASSAYDIETDTIFAFSRKQELNFSNTLNGFWNYIQSLPENVKDQFKIHPSWRVFGEWTAKKNKIIYSNIDKESPWYLYDIFDVEQNKWLTQDIVKKFAEDCGFNYIHELYYGPFISWEHCKSFMHSPAYGDRQEGIVCKLQKSTSDASVDDSHFPAYLKIVNDDFRESMKTHEKVIDPEKENARAEAFKIMESIVTKNRVEKELSKMRDEGIVPDKITNKDFGTIARNLPKRIYEDLLKEEKELLMACGEFGGKMCSSITIRIVREVIK